MKNLTIFTDASYCHESRAAGGAYWSRTEKEFLKNAFELRGLCASNEAELQTALTAVNQCIRAAEYADFWADNSEPVLIILVVDCLFVKDCLEGRTVKTRFLDEVQELHATIEAVGARLKINHVKGHTNCSKPRSWVNRWCDKMAGQEMRKYRNFLCGAKV